jgi:succinylarginine dihydrolase
MTTQRAESGGQRAKGMHWAHGKLQERKKVLQQITQEGTERHQMSETKRKTNPTGPYKARDMRQRAESGGQRACMRHTASSQGAANVDRLQKRAAAHAQTMPHTHTHQMSETKRKQNPTGPHKASDMRQRAESGGQRACMRHTASSQSQQM